MQIKTDVRAAEIREFGTEHRFTIPEPNNPLIRFSIDIAAKDDYTVTVEEAADLAMLLCSLPSVKQEIETRDA